jgi:hypothetical protein
MNSVAVKVELLEEPVELSDGWRWLVAVLQEVLEEVHCLRFVEIVAAIDIVLVPNFVNLFPDVLLTLEVRKSHGGLSGGIQVALDEPGHLLLLDEAVSVAVELEEEPLVSLHVWSWFALRSTEVSKEVSSLNFVQSAASVDVVLEPDLVHLISDEVLLVEVTPSVLDS